LAQDITELLGEKFEGFKGQAAIDKLLKEERGYIMSAFYREDIGDIALIWGDETVGLAHIIKRRLTDRYDINEFFSTLGEAIEKGNIAPSYENRFKIRYERKLIIIAPEIRGNNLTFVMTAHKTDKKA
jgi:hypothetical protein